MTQAGLLSTWEWFCETWVAEHTDLPKTSAQEQIVENQHAALTAQNESKSIKRIKIYQDDI